MKIVGTKAKGYTQEKSITKPKTPKATGKKKEDMNEQKKKDEE